MSADASVRPVDGSAVPPGQPALAPARAATDYTISPRPERPGRHGRLRLRRRGPAVLLRTLIGVREEILEWVPQERGRYTWYGAIVVNTALLGGASMVLAVTTVRGELPTAAAVAIGAIWFWVVLALDAWLVSSTHGHRPGGMWRTLVPRLLLSLLLGLAIAEPLLFQVFDKEIRQEITVANEQEVGTLRGTLVVCNPLDGSSTAGRPECAGHRLGVPGAPAELARQVRENAQKVKERQAQVSAMNQTLAQKMAAEQRECDRKKWIWRGRYADVTETCERARADTTAYRESSRLSTREAELTRLIEEGNRLTAKAAVAGDTYRPAVNRAIEERTRRHAESLDDDGLLTRAHALTRVAWSDWYAGFVAVVLHLLLLVVDAMPVLAKLMSGPTSYDRVLSGRLDSARRSHMEELQLRHACEAADHEARRHAAEQDAAHRMDEASHQYRLARSERAAAFHAELDARAARLRRF
ncbi:DUF4407 domain-containing protein [Streptomyces sp. NPDC015232]|uniref:DUF4407 domain-containing protein n=1 Tax=unclassified Streptomyces TaxID=2593676 RepID=UPI0036FC7738